MSLPEHILNDCIKGDDGYYVYWPTNESYGGAYTAHNLREIADHLDSKNEEWDRVIQEDPKL